MKADIGDAATSVMAEVVIDGEIALERVGVVPVRVNCGVEINAAEGGDEGVIDGAGCGGKGKGGPGGRVGVGEGLTVCLERLGDGVEESAGGGDVVIAGATTDGSFAISEWLIGEAEAWLKTPGWRVAQALGKAGFLIGQHRGTGDAILRAVGGIGIVDVSRAAGIDVGELLHIEGARVACRIDERA